MGNPFASLLPNPNGLPAADPLAGILPYAPPISDEEEDILAQTRVPLVEDLEEQISLLKDVLKRLQKTVACRTEERVADLTRRVQRRILSRLRSHTVTLPDDVVKKLTKDDQSAIYQAIYADAKLVDTVNAAIEQALQSHLEATLSFEDAAALQKGSKAIQDAVKQYRALLKGMVVNVNFRSEDFERLMRAVFEECDPATQARIQSRLEDYAPSTGEDQELNL